ncbi:TPA: hypothetical protein L4V39_005466 [Pseudomonas aeruginosa]|nr:hypothetical protein [Pseudomonas aeruginosa]
MSKELNKENCTCPSGDGSLAWPCPVHQASGEQAGWDERAAFEHAFTVQEGIYFDDKRGEYRSMNLRDVEVTDAQDLNLRLQGWQARAALAQPSPAQARSTWPKLEKPAQVGAVRFSAGVSSRLVVEAAQRLYEFESTPEKEAERIERLQAFREQLDPLNLAPHAKAFNEAPAEALKPEQAEAERPEVVGVRYEDGTILSAEDCGTALEVCAKVQTPLMTIAQHERIVGALRAERDGAIKLLGQSVWQKIERLTQERDAALAEVERLRESKGDPSGSFDRCMKMMYERDENAKQLEVALARVAELEAKPAEPTAVHQWQFSNAWFDGSEEAVLKAGKEGSPIRTLYTAPAQAQHSVPIAHEFKRALGLVVAALEADGDRPTSKYALSELKKVLAAAPGKEGA